MVAITPAFPRSAVPASPAHHHPPRFCDAGTLPPSERNSRLDGAGRVLGLAALAAVLVLSVGYLLRAPALDTSGAIPLQDDVHVVASGETMWSIAAEVAPAGEAATYVERLVEVNGSPRVVPGQVLDLPVP